MKRMKKSIYLSILFCHYAVSYTFYKTLIICCNHPGAPQFKCTGSAYQFACCEFMYTAAVQSGLQNLLDQLKSSAYENIYYNWQCGGNSPGWDVLVLRKHTGIPARLGTRVSLHEQVHRRGVTVSGHLGVCNIIWSADDREIERGDHAAL